MKEKEKSKFNPFAQILHPDEEILWSYTPYPYVIKLTALMKFNLVASAAALTLVGLCGVTLLLIKGGWPLEPLFNVFHALLYVLVYFMATSLLMQIVSSVSALVLPPLPRFYAITNMRLLTYEGHEITMLALEEALDLRRTKRTLSFGTLSQSWRDLEDIDTIVTLIQQAQAKHIRRLEMAHEESHERKREEQVQSLRTDIASR